MAVKRTGGLGRGLDALIPAHKPAGNAGQASKAEDKPKASAKAAKPQKSLLEEELEAHFPEEKPAEAPAVPETSAAAEPKRELVVNITSVEPDRDQPRKNFDEDALLELSESIKQYGILQPLLVSKKEDYYEIIAGERRWRAAKMAGLKEVPIIIKDFTEQERVEISLIENIQRENLNPVEEAMAYRRLMEEFHLKQDEIAERVSKSRTAVTNSMRLLKLDERVQQMLISEMISSGHARAILALPAEELQYTVAMQVFDNKLSVRETEKLVKSILEPAKKKPEQKSSSAEDAIFESLEEKMKGILGTKVMIQRKRNNKGRIEIEYYSKDELERIIELLESIR